MTDTAADRLRPLRRARQVREFTDEPVSREDLDALADVARWTGSSRNTQPWRFIVVTDVDAIRRIAEIGLPQTRALKSATAALAIVLPVDETHEIGIAYDDGRAAERILIAAGMLDLGAGIAWVRSTSASRSARSSACPLNATSGRSSRSATRPRRRSRRRRRRARRACRATESIFEERWPAG